METPIQLRHRLAFRLRRLAQPDWWFACLGIAMLAVVEVLGRRAESDLQDGLALVVLVGAFTLAYHAYGKSAIAWARVAVGPLGRLLPYIQQQRFDIGIDLRGTPPVPPETPRVIRSALVVLASIVVALLGLAIAGGIEYRAAATQFFYVGYLATLATLWVVLLVVIAMAVLLPAVCIHDFFACRHTGPGPRPLLGERAAIVGYFATALLLALALPIWAPAALCCLALGLFVTTLRYNSSSITLLWRRRGRSEIRSLSWQTYETQCACALAAAFLIVVLLSTGRAAVGFSASAVDTMPVTESLGQLAAWLGSMALSSGAVFSSWWISRQRQRDPARPSPTVLHIGEDPADTRGLAAILRPRGWQARFSPDTPEPCDVRIRIVPSPSPPLGAPPYRWPLRVSMRALEVSELQHILGRRDEIQRRRALVNGFERLFKRAAQRSFRRGQGFWIAPQHWYISGMTRDLDDEDSQPERGSILSGIVGPAYHRVFPREARNHFYLVLRALEVDLIFLQDGVGFRGFRRVLRVLFEHYDIHGDRQPVQDRHFRGLPGLRVLLHDYQLGNPLKKKGYPEPDYETLGRARILHVFRDRGDHEELVPDPVDLEGAPVPLGV